MKEKKHYEDLFPSDNAAKVHSEIIENIVKVNENNAIAYGEDEITEEVNALFKEHFGSNSETYIVTLGTAANVLALQTCLKFTGSILCAQTSHIYNDECGAVDKHTSGRLVPIPTKNGKINVLELEEYLNDRDFVHAIPVMGISISQTTEKGTVYSLEEMQGISEFCKKHKLYFHVDGARFANACVALKSSFQEVSSKVGVDILSFGGTKNGALMAESVVIFNEKLKENFHYIHKQGMQLISKMRYFSVQFKTLLSNDLWKKNAKQANYIAKILEKELQAIEGVSIMYPVEANLLFLKISAKIYPKVFETFHPYMINKKANLMRIVTNFNSKEEEVVHFVKVLKEQMQKVIE